MSVLAAHALRSRLVGMLVTTALMASLVVRFGPTPRMLPYAWIAAIAVPLTVADLTTRRLPNRIILPSYPIVLGLLGVAVFADQSLASLQRALLGMGLTLALYGTPYLLAPHAIGGGDVKLAGLLGLPLAYSSWSALLTATVVAWFLAAVAVVTMHIASRVDQPVPLGPCLIVGTLLICYIH